MLRSASVRSVNSDIDATDALAALERIERDSPTSRLGWRRGSTRRHGTINDGQMIQPGRICVLVVACALALGCVGVAVARVPPQWKNCTAVNARYPHGIGKPGGRDRTSGEPVTTFKRSTALYRLAMTYNRGLDCDKDEIACEKA
jgi:hypothetical protein